MKKRAIVHITLVIGIFMFCIGTWAVSAASSSEHICVFVDNKQVEFDVEPQLIGGRTMVPLRAIFEELGATVNWDENTKTVTAYNEAYIVKCTINQNQIYVNNIAKEIDVAPMVVDGRTLVPVRFIAEAFQCKVEWNADTFSVNITSQPINYSSLEQATPSQHAVSSPAPSTILQSDYGTRNNPFHANEGATIEYNEYSFEPTRKIQIVCTNVISGSRANDIIYSENQFNDRPNYNQEWILLEFDVKYISSSEGYDDVLEGSDIIYQDTFFKRDGSSVNVADMATFSHAYDGYGVFDVELYPGSSGKIAIGLLIEKNSGDLLLRVPYNAKKNNSWILCTP